MVEKDFDFAAGSDIRNFDFRGRMKDLNRAVLIY